MSRKTLKILASGDVDGRFDQLFSRVSSIQKKNGSFDLLLCVGNFFGSSSDAWEPYSRGEKKVPISTLVLGPNSKDHEQYYKDMNGEEICENVTYLGKKGIFSGSSGLQIAYLSGIEGETSDKCHFNVDDVLSLTAPATADNNYVGIDILITSQWPKGVDKYAAPSPNVDLGNIGSNLISQLAIQLRPRYHICALEGIFYERQPYRNHIVLSEKERHVTRFLSLAKVGNSEKQKFLYAFNIIPLKHEDPSVLTKQPPDVTECPYSKSKLTSSQAGDGSQQFFYQMSSDTGNKRKRDGDGNQKKKQHRTHAQPTGPCWFCLGSPEVEKHLVVSVGEQTYLALAKGGMVDDHILILPIGHHQSTVLAPADVDAEINKYKQALKKMFKSQNKCVVFFERNYRTQHLQIQVVPLPQRCLQDVKQVFMDCAEDQKLDLNEIPTHSDIRQIIAPEAPYFYVELPTNDKLFCRISRNFPLQFGREVLASPQLLNMEDRVDWRNCKVSFEEETELAQQFKDMFKDFDFNFLD